MVEFCEGGLHECERNAFELDMHLCCAEKKNQDTFSDSSWVVPLLEKFKQMFGVLPHHSDLKLTLIQSDRCKRQVWGRRASYSWPPSDSSQASSCTLTPPRLTGEGRSNGVGTVTVWAQ